MSTGGWLMAVALGLTVVTLLVLIATTIRSIQDHRTPGRGVWREFGLGFLLMFSFVTLSALYIHKGSAESKDTDEKLEASLRRIEEHLGTLPPPDPDDDGWQLPATPMDVDAQKQ